MNILINSDIDLLDAAGLRKRPVDRIEQAQVIPYSKGISLFTVDKIIVINKYMPEELENIKLLSRSNKIINRIPEFKKDLSYTPYPKLDILNMGEGEVSLAEIQKCKDVRIIKIDDLLISNKLITFK